MHLFSSFIVLKHTSYTSFSCRRIGVVYIGVIYLISSVLYIVDGLNIRETKNDYWPGLSIHAKLCTHCLVHILQEKMKLRKEKKRKMYYFPRLVI